VRLLRTGDVVRLDGTNGRIQIVNRAEDPQERQSCSA
jgi:hypothetical protein